jgi:hypothetical protein
MPKVNIIEDAPDAMWELLRLRATSFTEKELQHEDPISTAHSSIGEEISSAEVVKARWTPPGIAKNGRCALLILSQNLLLSLWAPEKSGRSHQDWKRGLLLNRAVQEYFERLYPDLKVKEGAAKSERLKELIRVRAFAVNQPVSALTNSCLVAVSNDNNQIIVLRCQGSQNEEGGTEVTVQALFSITNDTAPVPTLSWTFEDYMSKTRFVQHLAWSPWVYSDGIWRCVVACADRHHLLFRWVVLHDSGGVDVNVTTEAYDGSLQWKKHLPADAILEWLPSIHDGKYGRMLVSTLDKVYLFAVNLAEGDEIHQSQFERKGWSQIAGTLLQDSDGQNPLLQTMTHGTFTTSFLTSIEVDSMREVDSQLTGLEKAIALSRDAFNQKHNTRGNVSTRLWGLAASPLEDFAVTCATFHPSNSPEYIIPADMSARVIFQSTEQKAFMTRAIQQGASTEAIAFSAKWLFKMLKSEPEKRQAIWDLLDQIDRVMDATAVHEPDPTTSSFKDLLFTSAVLVKIRYERILSIMMGHKDAALEGEKPIIEHLAVRVLHVPDSRYRSTLTSDLMLANFQRVLGLFNLSAENLEHLPAENCSICSSRIPFTNYATAQCTRGHSFRRCALTFLAIQAPGICRFCGICGKQFLKASKVESQNSGQADVEMGEASGNGGGRPLTELLCEACERCVYCGGKFVG